ncbi:MAG: putative LPS assembly protein LptD [Chitinophagaceae bacterium]|nr:putative LPS assembly protein LptD [Chitinophagaceae bacterium]
MATLIYSQTWKSSICAYSTKHRNTVLTFFLTTYTDTTKPLQKKIKEDVTQDTSISQHTDSLITEIKTDTFYFKISKDSLDAPVRYRASDSAVVFIREKKIYLFGKTKTEHKDMLLTAPKVELDQQTNIITAMKAVDSAGRLIEQARFKNATNEFVADTMRFNFKTQVGITKNTTTKEGEFFMYGQAAKKVNENTTFIKGARFTTCNLDEPHFAFLTGKMKVVNNKVAVSGPTHPEFEGVPVPIWLPFGLYPLTKGRHSGFLPPRFSANEQFGLGLEGMGYYKVLNDYWDAKIFGNLYSYGGWSLNLNPTYRRRYKYNGSFKFSILSTKLNFKGDPDFVRNKSFSISWSHAIDGKARPGTNFTASVNAGSTRYNQFIPNNANQNFQNQLYSSITYSKAWPGKPYNITLAANHNQNNLTRLVNVSLPDIGFTVNTLFPFQGKNATGTKWYEKLGIAYNGTFRNQFSFYDSAFRFRKIIDTLQWGAQHNFPVTLALPPVLGGAIIISPGVSYSQIWAAQKLRRKWNPATQKADTTITKGFFTDHQLSFSLGFNTAIFGTFEFRKSKVVAIRHVIRPTVSFNYRPDLSRKFYYTDTLVRGFVTRFSELSGALYPGFAEGKSGGIGIQFDNNLEMKVRSRKDTAEGGIKKVKLIDGFGFTTGYNFLRDSMKLDVFNLYIRTTLFEKISITANSVLSPYQTNAIGQDIAKYAWQGGRFRIGRLTNGSISVSTNFESKPKDPKKEEERKKQAQMRLADPALIMEQQQLLDYMRQNPSEFVDFNIPWRVNLNYSLSFFSRFNADKLRFTTEFTSNISFNGGFNLSPKWNLSANGFYDIRSKKLQMFTMGITRDMHCWQMTIDVTPIGLFRYFSFSISPKSSVLQDLRINRTRMFPNF